MINKKLYSNRYNPQTKGPEGLPGRRYQEGGHILLLGDEVGTANFNWIAEGAGGTIISGANTLAALKRNLEEILPSLPHPWD